MKPTLFEGLVGVTAHLIALAGVMHLVINLIGWPLFPAAALLFLIPNGLLLLLALPWSRFVRAHVIQAITVNLLRCVRGHGEGRHGRTLPVPAHRPPCRPFHGLAGMGKKAPAL
jgi:hypothetical protein